MQSLGSQYKALIIGASGGIGHALTEQLQSDPNCEMVLGLSRTSLPSIDFSDEQSIVNAATHLRSHSYFDLIVIATGFLHNKDFMPEKKLGDINFAQLQMTFQANTFGPALALRHFIPLLEPKRSIFAVLSAKVGSISDNRLGGWYSYRASKAALNMLVKTAAIEVRRTNPNAALVAMHPGTVNSRLSKPFKGETIGRAAADAASDLLSVIDHLKAEQSGQFLAYDGHELPW